VKSEKVLHFLSLGFLWFHIQCFPRRPLYFLLRHWLAALLRIVQPRIYVIAEEQPKKVAKSGRVRSLPAQKKVMTKRKNVNTAKIILIFSTARRNVINL